MIDMFFALAPPMPWSGRPCVRRPVDGERHPPEPREPLEGFRLAGRPAVPGSLLTVAFEKLLVQVIFPRHARAAVEVERSPCGQGGSVSEIEDREPSFLGPVRPERSVVEARQQVVQEHGRLPHTEHAELGQRARAKVNAVASAEDVRSAGRTKRRIHQKATLLTDGEAQRSKPRWRLKAGRKHGQVGGPRSSGFIADVILLNANDARSEFT